MEVFSPGTKNMMTYLMNRVLVYVYREFRLRESPGALSQIRADELPIQHPLTEAIVRKRLKLCADLKVDPPMLTVIVFVHLFVFLLQFSGLYHN
jgi:transcription initiation factor TFIID subunit 1